MSVAIAKCTMVPSDVIKWGSFGNDLHNIRIPRLVQRMAVATKWGGKLRHLVTLVPIQRLLCFQEVSQLRYLFEEERTLFEIIFWSIISLFWSKSQEKSDLALGFFIPSFLSVLQVFPNSSSLFCNGNLLLEWLILSRGVWSTTLHWLWIDDGFFSLCV